MLAKYKELYKLLSSTETELSIIMCLARKLKSLSGCTYPAAALNVESHHGRAQFIKVAFISSVSSCLKLKHLGQKVLQSSYFMCLF